MTVDISTHPVRILAYRGTSWLSRAIRWFTRSDYSHIAVMLPDGRTWEAWGRGVSCQPHPWAIHRPGTLIEVYEIADLLPAQSAAIAAACAQEDGQGYDFMAILGFVLRWRRDGHPRRWVCSEYAFAACLTAGIELLRDIPAWCVCPGRFVTSPRLRLLCWARSNTEMQRRLANIASRKRVRRWK